MTEDQYNEIDTKLITMSHFLDTYKEILDEQVTELAKFANNLDKVSLQLQEVCELIKNYNKQSS